MVTERRQRAMIRRLQTHAEEMQSYLHEIAVMDWGNWPFQSKLPKWQLTIKRAKEMIAEFDGEKPDNT